MTNEPRDVFTYISMKGRDECWPWHGPFGGRARDRRPYFSAERERKMAYRWVWELVNGPIPDGMMILHSCDNGGAPVGCCNPYHMRLGTLQENTKDMTDRQRHGLPHNVIRAIRKLLSEGRTQHEIASLYGISRESVSAIATGRVYGHVQDVSSMPQDDGA